MKLLANPENLVPFYETDALPTLQGGQVYFILCFTVDKSNQTS